MKRAIGMLVGVVAVGLVSVSLAFVSLRAQTRSTPSGPQPVSDAIRASWEGAKKNMKESAADVPEAVYSYSPVPSVVRT